MNLNAGQRLWLAQKQQGTGLCVGIDMHYDPKGPFNEEFYSRFSRGMHDNLESAIDRTLTALSYLYPKAMHHNSRTINFVWGMINYFLGVIDTAWAEGIRVYKPQVATFEQLTWFQSLALVAICARLEQLERMTPGALLFKLLDAKRGDIGTTQAYYYRAYLSGVNDEVIPGLGGLYNFDTMTVTTWMGEDVLTPGLEFFRRGKGATVVTRTSNPSGTSLQDARVDINPQVELKFDQQKFALTAEQYRELSEIVEDVPTTHEAMLYLTEQFSRTNGLDQDGTSPIFSVMGATVKFDSSFRKIRPNAIPLIPAFGAQAGEFANILPLAIADGPNAGHIGVLNNSRATNFAWVEKWGGSGDPKKWQLDLVAAIKRFREDEKAVYRATGLHYPF